MKAVVSNFVKHSRRGNWVVILLTKLDEHDKPLSTKAFAIFGCLRLAEPQSDQPLAPQQLAV